MRFISIDKSGGHAFPQWSVTKEARERLESLKDTLRIVSIVGRYRDGKSWLGNWLVSGYDGAEHFSTSNSVRPQTRGLDIANSFIPNTNILLMDTEGLNSNDSSITLDTQIMALAVLCSSKVIYNCKQSVGAREFDGLKCALDTATTLLSKTDTTTQHSHPELLWLLRDFALDLRDSKQEAISPNEYLEDQLNNPGPASMLRESLNKLFSKRSCVPLPMPCKAQDLAEMKNLFPSFKAALSVVADEVHATPTKQIDGAEITGPMLLAMADTMCQLLSRGEAPQLESICESLRNVRIREAQQRVMDQFKINLAASQATLPALTFQTWDHVGHELQTALHAWVGERSKLEGCTDDGGVAVACLQYANQASEAKLAHWLQDVEKCSPEIVHMMPPPLRMVLAPIVEKCTKLEDELVQVQLAHDNLQATIDTVLAQPSAEPLAHASEDEMRSLQEENTLLRTQYEETKMMQTTFMEQFQQQLGQLRELLQTKSAEVEQAQAERDKISDELNNTQQQLQSERKANDVQLTRMATMETELSDVSRKRALEVSELRTTRITLMKVQREFEQSEKNLKRAQSDKERVENDAKRHRSEVLRLENEVMKLQCVSSLNQGRKLFGV